MLFLKAVNLRSAILVLGIVALSPACLEKHDKVKVEGQNDEIAYTLGHNFGEQILANSEGLNVDVIVAGLLDGFGGNEAKLSAEQKTAAMQAFRTQRQEKMKVQQDAAGAQNKAKGEAFLAANKSKEGVVTTASGLQYKVITEGKGEKPTANSKVTVHYRGTLVDGTEFDSSIKRGQPATFGVSGVIKGWTEALQLMAKGSKWELYIPSELAYGPRGPGKIGPDAVLIFEVELLEVTQ